MMEEMWIALRPETTEDGDFLHRLYVDTRRWEVGQWGWPAEQQAMFLRMQFEARRRAYRDGFPNAARWIVQVLDVDAGRMLVDEDAAGVHLVDIALLADYRKRGIGTGLLTGLQRECFLGKKALRLQVQTANPARRLYRRLGFAEVGQNADAMYVQMEWRPAPCFKESDDPPCSGECSQMPG